MTEWGVVTVIIALVGFLIAIIKPITSLTQSITKLTTIVDRLDQDMHEQKAHSHDAHQRLWEHNVEQDKQIQDHEARISNLEGATHG